MCGITGFIDYGNNSSRDVLEKMTLSLSHRGPDDSGTFFHENDLATIGLGHTRLSVLDLSPLGHQPMTVGHLTITFNGEIYNFDQVRQALEKDGIKFNSHSDTEVIIRSFQRWGIECLQQFRGMFSFVILDQEKLKVWIVRDRVGVKPLFYYEKHGLLLFASELKAFHHHPIFLNEKEIDLGSLGLFMQYSYIPGPHCIFKNTKKLEPGHFLEISLRDKSIVLRKYWSVLDYYNKPSLEIDDHEAIDEMERILTESFNYRMVSDVPVGLFLSGGFDSSAVAAILQKNRTEKLKTFTIGFDAAGFDEAPDAKKIANRLGTDHTEYYCTPADALGIIPRLPEIYDEPFADNSTIPSVMVSQLARKSVTVALSGDGGDEIFAGYNKFSQALSLAGGWSWSKSLLSGAMSLINPERIPVLRDRYNFSTRYEKMKLILDSKDPSEILKIISQYVPHTEVKKLIQLPYENFATKFDLNGAFKNPDPLAKMLAIDYLTFLNDNNLTKMDRATMSVALEGREPFLDQSIIEFAAQLPSHLKLRNGMTKYILKNVVYRYLPKELMDRPKKPFIAPLSVWFMEQLKSFFLHYLDKERLENEGYFATAQVIKMRNQFLSGKPISHQKLWNLLIFEMWFERWMK